MIQNLGVWKIYETLVVTRFVQCCLIWDVFVEIHGSYAILSWAGVGSAFPLLTHWLCWHNEPCPRGAHIQPGAAAAADSALCPGGGPAKPGPLSQCSHHHSGAWPARYIPVSDHQSPAQRCSIYPYSNNNNDEQSPKTSVYVWKLIP